MTIAATATAATVDREMINNNTTMVSDELQCKDSVVRHGRNMMYSFMVLGAHAARTWLVVDRNDIVILVAML